MKTNNLFEFDKNTGTIVYYKGNANELIIIPEEIDGVTVKRIGRYAFCKSRKICVVILPNTICEIGEGAFYECKALVSINIPEKVTEIKNKTFYNDSNLEYLFTKSDNIKVAQDAFFGCINLKE